MFDQPKERPKKNNFYSALRARDGEIEARYRELTPRSRALLHRAAKSFPGGYTRDAFLRAPYAPFIASAQGTQITDADGRQITDLWFNSTSLPLGHAHPEVVAAAARQLPCGTAYFAPTELELALAELLIERIPCAERLRFTNSGSEAIMMALRFARAVRDRTVTVKFEGSYHGTYDDVSWSASPDTGAVGQAQKPVPAADTAGLGGPDGRVTVLRYNDPQSLRDHVKRHHTHIAAILIEPVASRTIGLILPDIDFVEEARSLCDRYGIVLIFDEVMAFRVAYGGAQSVLGVTPDLMTMGKIIGGGFPVGAVAGRADILDRSDPARRQGRVAHAGTFNGNPMVGAAGHATMSLLTPETFERINAAGARLRAELALICDGLPLEITGAGSLFKITATDRKIQNYRDAATADTEWERAASLCLLNEGFMLAPQLAGCVSAVTPASEVDAFLAAFRRLVAG